MGKEQLIPKSLKRAIEEVRQVKAESDLDQKASETLAAEQIADSRSTRGLREKYAGWVYWYLVGYSLCSFSLLVADGFNIYGFDLDTTVVSIIVGSTAVSALGLVGLVIKGLFK